MSFTPPPGTPAARQVRELIRGAGAALSGKTRGLDRAVRRHSYDVNDPRARPWSRIGDGSAAQGLAHRDALLQTAEELWHKGWKDLPPREIRDARTRRAALAAELEQHQAAGDAPTGRPATLRREIGRLDAVLERARQRLRRIDVTVLKAVIRRIDFATGQLFPALETIADDASCHRNSVIGALRRLRLHGFINWVRRSVRTENEGAFAPQREQTSNAYFFEHRQRMAPRVWQRFWQILVAKMRRAGPIPMASALPEPPDALPLPTDPALRAALRGLEEAVHNAST